MNPNTEKPSVREVTNYSVGLALGMIATWALGFAVTVPGEIGAAIGTLCVFVVWRLGLVDKP